MSCSIGSLLLSKQETQIQSLSWEDPQEKGTALQYFWLENYMDRGTWWTTVNGVAKCQTQLSN